MNRHLRISLTVLALVWAAFAVHVISSSGELPERVATHFGDAGRANGWMTRREHVVFTILGGLLVPGFVLGIFFVMGRFPEKSLNISHKEHWLAPERRDDTVTFVRLQGVRYATIFIGFLSAIHWSTLAANRQHPPLLPASQVAWISGLFLAANLVWAIVFVRHFIRRSS